MPRGFRNLSVNFAFLWEDAVKLLNNFWGVNIRSFPGPLAQVSVDTVQWCSPATASFNDKCSFRPWMNRDFSILAYNIHLVSILSAQHTGFGGEGKERINKSNTFIWSPAVSLCIYRMTKKPTDPYQTKENVDLEMRSSNLWYLGLMLKAWKWTWNPFEGKIRPKMK